MASWNQGNVVVPLITVSTSLTSKFQLLCEVACSYLLRVFVRRY